MQDVQFVVLQMSNGAVGLMQFQTRVRTIGGFVKREATDDAIAAEVTKAGKSHEGNPQSGWPALAWARIDASQSRYRSAVRWNGKAMRFDMPAARELRSAELQRSGVKLSAAINKRIAGATTLAELDQIE